MHTFSVELHNCYGIPKLEHTFDFRNTHSYAIYAPNGMMKTSFTKSLHQLSKGEEPSEPRHGRPARHLINIDDIEIDREAICVLQSDCTFDPSIEAVTSILVSPEYKAKYDELIVNLTKLKTKVIDALRAPSGIKKASDVEKALIEDLGAEDAFAAIASASKVQTTDDLSIYKHAVLFEQRALEVLRDPKFLVNAAEFSRRYNEVFMASNTLYRKGVFNPTKAKTTSEVLDKHGYFDAGHLVHLQGSESPCNKQQFEVALKQANQAIDDDAELKNIRDRLVKNISTQALATLFETLTTAQVEDLITRISDEKSFRKDLWSFYLSSTADAALFNQEYQASVTELLDIEQKAAASTTQWRQAIDLFNMRFIGMPFKLEVKNYSAAALGRDVPELCFRFGDEETPTECTAEVALKTLSQGEKRALYLLAFIFEVEARRIKRQQTLFILDDIADSFDYKNKHAITQYLADLNQTDCFYQIILTHNFDFFRNLVNIGVVKYPFLLMANRRPDSIQLVKARGVKNYFVGEMRDKVGENQSILCASIPFTRNLIEYTQGEESREYLRLTSMMHWKPDTNNITVDDYVAIYNNTFVLGNKAISTYKGSIITLIFETASKVCSKTEHDSLCLEDKIVLSMACRLRAEQYMTKVIRTLTSNSDYWCEERSQFGKLLKKFKELSTESHSLKILECVRITVSSNIHINSFMYEPILDLTIEHLCRLYKEVNELCTEGQS